MPKHLRLLLPLLVLAATGACYGTVYTRMPDWRSKSTAQSFGWPLFEAVHADFDMIAQGGGGHQVQWWVSALIGWPVDLVLDVVFLPFDVIGGLSGDEKNRVETWELDPADGPRDGG